MLPIYATLLTTPYDGEHADEVIQRQIRSDEDDKATSRTTAVAKYIANLDALTQ